MVTKKSSSGKNRKLKVKKETLKNLDSSEKAKGVKGGQRDATMIASCGHTFGMLCCGHTHGITC